jgi:hypothetical protein
LMMILPYLGKFQEALEFGFQLLMHLHSSLVAGVMLLC